MAIRERGGMWCPRCRQPVAARRNGHAVRNSAGLLGALPTLGLSLLATKTDSWHCPTCGGPVQRGAVRSAQVPIVAPDTSLATVTLLSPGPRTIAAMRVYRRVTGQGLREAQAAMEGVPTIVGHFDPGRAETIVADFKAAGASAELAHPDAAPPGSTSPDVASDLAKLAELHHAGCLTDGEFAAAKARTLG